MDAASRQRATRRIVSGDSHTQAPCPSWSVFEWGTSSSPDPSSCASINSTATATSSDTRKPASRSEEHTSELQSLMRISYAVFCLKKKKKNKKKYKQHNSTTMKRHHDSYTK